MNAVTWRTDAEAAPGAAPEAAPLAPLVVPGGESPIRGERPLRALDAWARRAETWVSARLPDRVNPLACTGAMATAALLVATATGVLLLPFYTPTVEGAHASVRAIESARWTLGIVRSLHRYASDAAMAFALVHLLRLLLQRRVAGPRVVAWVSGAGLLALTALVGWLGYWLAWDDAGALVAQETARAADALPFFAEPLSRSFLTDDGLSSPLFFVVFFAHVLMPLAMAVMAWVHVLRTPRPKLLPSRPLWIAAIAGLVALAAAFPATSGAAATMARVPGAVGLDPWYLLPLALTPRIGAAATLGAVVAAFVLLAALPWLLRRGRPRIAEVVPSSCNACERCIADCPYGAIELAPRGDLPGKEPMVARVNPARCVGCGICSGSCEPGGIGLPWMGSLRERAVVESAVRGGATVVAWACEEIATRDLADRVPAGCELVVVPCAGFVHALSVERALRRGAERVLVFPCGSSTCRHRDGGRLFDERLHGRAPALRTDRVDASRVKVVTCAVLDAKRLAREVARAAEPARTPGRMGRVLAAAACAIVLLPLPLLRARSGGPPPTAGELVVAFRHPGAVVENCRDRTPEELAELPPHMRTPRECTRKRSPVTLRVSVDGRTSESVHPGAGAWHDGESSAVVRLPLPLAARHVAVELDDGHDVVRAERDVQPEAGVRVTALFDRERGFTWH